jgi:hypothetical protein
MSITQPHIEGAKVILWTPIDDRHRATGGCRHSHNGQFVGAASWMAICRFDEGEACYLFQYHPDSDFYSDTFHESIEDAKHQAEFEYEGVSKTWIEAA